MYESRKVALICALGERRNRIESALEAVDATVQAFSTTADFQAEDHSLYQCVVVDHSESCCAIEVLGDTNQYGCPTLVLAQSATTELVVESFRKGAFHFIDQLDNGRLTDAVREGLDLAASENVKRQSKSRFTQFNADEHRVIQLVIQGTSNREIAQILGLGVRTVERIRSRILSKSGACSLPNAVQFYTLAFGPTVAEKAPQEAEQPANSDQQAVVG
ncbi:MAG: LuxR C-terminal-related transcriptional regulator [Planctomycetota bacterium]